MVGKSFEEGIHFALSMKRMIPVFLIMTVFIYGLMYFVISLDDFSFMLTKNITAFLMLGLGTIAFSLIMVFVNATMTHQAMVFPKQISLRKSFSYAEPFFLRIIGASILLGIISSLANLIPYISIFFTILFSLMFLFIQPSIVIGRKRILDSFRESYGLFRKHAGKVFVTWLAISLVSAFVLILSLVPVGIGFILYALPDFSTAQTSSVIYPTSINTFFLSKIFDFIRSPLALILALIVSIGFSFITLFSIGTIARLYVNLKKSRKSK